MGPIRLGIPQHISARPLVFGLMRSPGERIHLSYSAPSLLADSLERGLLDAALVPSIEYLRGGGRLYVDGPGLVAKSAEGNVILVARKPLEEIERVAVDEFCRTPVAVLRIVLGEQHHVTPDFLVEKNPSDWRESYDAILLSGDAALRYRISPPVDGDTPYNVAGMWHALTSLPLVSGLWVYNDPALATELQKALIASRNLGLQNLSHLADGIAQTSQFEGEFLYEYLNTCWSYDMHEKELLGLHALEEYALRYDLLRRGRLEGVTAG